MRPLKIVLEGFSAYRAPVEVDFTDVDFFSLSGPTGAGKSSLVDALVFALYGRVPRLGGRAVAPAIAAGTHRARVRLDFEVNNVSYAVARLAERTRSGAKVSEARLQRGETVLAAGADEVTKAVEDLLKLRFEDFTKTVVLPQGEFARFLTAPKAERQALLRSLLGLHIYTDMRGLAKTRAAVAGERAAIARATLQGLAVPDDHVLEETRRRVDSLETLAEIVRESDAALAGHEAALRTVIAERDLAVGAIERLESIAAPDRLTELEAAAATSREKVETLTQQRDAELAAQRALEIEVSAIPSFEELAKLKTMREKLGDLSGAIANLDLSGALHALETAKAAHERATSDLAAAVGDLETARLSHAAHALAMTLVVGEPCPVCRHPIEEATEIETPILEPLEEAVLQGKEALENATSELDRSRSAHVRAETTLGELSSQHDSLVVELDGVPDEVGLVELEERRRAKDRELDTLRESVSLISSAIAGAEREMEDLTDAIRRLDKNLVAAQLTVADLAPPVSESDDVIVRWKDLLLWREEALARQRVGLEETTTRLSVLDEALEKAKSSLVAELTRMEIQAMPPFSAQVAAERERVKARLANYEKAAADADELRRSIGTSERTAAVAAALANHLKSNGFEQWLMSGALSDLVAGANGLLDELSHGGYSLHSDETGSFSIVDHRNADELRDVATLSGGETFLVSLALALSLAETLASSGGASLDAIILDEGFGTLDEESLDTVSRVLEDLAGDGLMVGVITHVKELAARAPVRYEVSRLPTGSTVSVST